MSLNELDSQLADKFTDYSSVFKGEVHFPEGRAAVNTRSETSELLNKCLYPKHLQFANYTAVIKHHCII